MSDVKVDKDLENFNSILKHVKNVHSIGEELCRELIKSGRARFARKVIVEIYKHDLSKFQDYEFERFFSEDKKMIEKAIDHHQRINPHHIQYYDSYKEMPDIELACMACDLKARSEGFGSDVKGYFKSFCEEKGITNNTNFYKKITGFLNLIIEDKFQ